MDPRNYPRDAIENKWRNGAREHPCSCSARELSGLGQLRYVFPWPAFADRSLGDRAPVESALDVSFLRRLTVADAFARQLRHAGRRPYYSHVIEGATSRHPAHAAGSAGSEPDLELRLGIGDDSAAVAWTWDPLYFRYTQWLFLELFSHGLVVRSKRLVRSDGARVEVPEWRLDLLPYAERLFGDIDKSSWSAEARKQQKSIIGRRRGAEILFPVSRPYDGEFEQIAVFTTQAESIYGVTFLLVSAHHPLLPRLTDPDYASDIERYRQDLAEGRAARVSAVRTGGFAVNPVSLERIPILCSPLAETAHSEGVAAAVPAHDVELFALSRDVRLPIREVIHSSTARFDHNGRLVEPYIGEGVMTNSGPYNGMNQRAARERIINTLARRGMCRRTTRYSLRSLPLSGVLAGGPPVPLVHCPSCGCVAVAGSDLPVVFADAAAGAGGELAGPAVACPKCRGAASRDPTRILPWFSQAWSFLRPPLPQLGEGSMGFERLAPLLQPAVVEQAAAVGTVAAGTTAMGGLPPAADSPPESFEPGSSESGLAAASPGDSALEELAAAIAAPPAASQDAAGDPAGEPGDGVGDSALAADGHGAPGESATATAGAAERGGAGGAGAEDAEEEEDDSDDEPDQDDDGDSRKVRRITAGTTPGIRPFHSDSLQRLLPIDVVFAPNDLSPHQLVGTRFLAKVLFDLEHIPVFEPFRRFFRVGPVVLASAGDFVEILDRHGADAVRLHLLAQGPLYGTIRTGHEQVYPWKRFLDRLWRQMCHRIEKGRFVSRRVLEQKHRTIFLVTERLRRLKFHTAASAIVEFINFLSHPDTSVEEMDRRSIEAFAIILSPFAPFIAQELWSMLGHDGSVLDAPWPEYSAELVTPAEREVTIWIDGKVRDRMTQPVDLPAERLEALALDRDIVRQALGSRRIRRVVTQPGKVVAIALERQG